MSGGCRFQSWFGQFHRQIQDPKQRLEYQRTNSHAGLAWNRQWMQLLYVLSSTLAAVMLDCKGLSGPEHGVWPEAEELLDAVNSNRICRRANSSSRRG